MNDNVIQSKVQPFLTTKEKARHNKAAQHFIKGAEKFLIEYNSQLGKIIDVDEIKKRYKDSFQQRAQQIQQTISEADDVNKSSKNTLGTLMMFGTFAFLTGLAFKDKIASYSTELKRSFQQYSFITQSTGNAKTTFDKASEYIKKISHIDVKKNIQMGIINLATYSMFPVLRLLQFGFDVFFNGQTYQNDNVIAYLMQIIVKNAANRALEKSSIKWLLELFGFKIGEQVKIRPNLHNFLRFGSRAFADLNQAIDQFNKGMQDYGEQAYQYQWLGTLRARHTYQINHRVRWLADSDGDGSYNRRIVDENDEDENDEWVDVEPAIKNFIEQNVYQASGNYAKSLRSGAVYDIAAPPGLSWDQYVAHFSAFTEVDLEGTTTQVDFKNMIFIGSQPIEILNLTQNLLNELQDYQKQHPVYQYFMRQIAAIRNLPGKSVLLETDEWGWTQPAISMWEYGKIMYLHSSAVAFIYQIGQNQAVMDAIYRNSGNQDVSYIEVLYNQSSSDYRISSKFSWLSQFLSNGVLQGSQFNSKLEQYVYSNWRKGQQMFLSFKKKITPMSSLMQFGKLLEICRLYKQAKFRHQGRIRTAQMRYEGSSTLYAPQFITFDGKRATPQSQANRTTESIGQQGTSVVDLTIGIIQNYTSRKKYISRLRQERAIMLKILQQTITANFSS